MKWIFDDGGRAVSGYRGNARDCVCRAIAIATGYPYQSIYEEINRESCRERFGKTKGSCSHARKGVHIPTIRRLMTRLGWKWTPTMQIGSGCKVHLRDGELPMGRIIVSVSKHCVAVIDGVIHDTHDCSRNGNRCVYGYWQRI